MKRLRRAAVAALAVSKVCGIALAASTTSNTAGDVAFLLGMASPETAARVRGSCASGNEPASNAIMRQAGVKDLPDIVDSCIAALARLGRDGTLSFVRDTRSLTTTPALAFDSGFVNAYRKAEPIPSALPSMAAVKPIAARCIAQAEPNTGLCSSAGYVYGARIAGGEPVPTI